MEDLANLPPPSQVPSKHFQMFYLLCFWGLRNHCHDVVFRALPPSQYSRIAAKCVEDATLLYYDTYLINLYFYITMHI